MRRLMALVEAVVAAGGAADAVAVGVAEAPAGAARSPRAPRAARRPRVCEPL
jgi:hypothetical protein